ncbi:MAG: hypothetical protein FJ390_02435, partial [Verrucomicrobia bacterium]|nr:hypothetical protein [Verrucomicrobiota bacterium]
MKFPPVLSLILFLVGTTFSLQALPMLGGGAERPKREQRAGAAQQQEEAGRRLSERHPSITETDSMEHIDTLPSSTSATTTAAVAGAEPTDKAAKAPGVDSVGSLGEHAVTAVPEQARPRYRLGRDDKWEEQHPEKGAWEPTNEFEDTAAILSSTGSIETPEELKA